MYNIAFTKKFDRQLRKYKKRDLKTFKLIQKVLDILEKEPFHLSLQTHGANIKDLGYNYSSRVTGDIRIAWNFDKSDSTIILCLTVGGHGDVYQ